MTAVRAVSGAAPTADTPFAAADKLLAHRGHSFHWARRLLSARHAERATRLYGFCRRIDDIADELVDERASSAAAAHQANVRRALQLMNSNQVRAFEIEREPAVVRGAYGNSQFGRSLLLARRLVEAGVPFIEVTLEGWDDHGSAYRDIGRRAQYVDPAISYLIDDLKRALKVAKKAGA